MTALKRRLHALEADAPADSWGSVLDALDDGELFELERVVGLLVDSGDPDSAMLNLAAADLALLERVCAMKEMA